jgi:hypothetical protein
VPDHSQTLPIDTWKGGEQVHGTPEIVEILCLQAGASKHTPGKLEAFIASIVQRALGLTNRVCRPSVLKTQQVRTEYDIASLA